MERLHTSVGHDHVVLKFGLVAAKARVAPIRQTTIPRLELMAALLASRLAKTVYDEFKIKPSSVVLWTDSMIVLAWIQAETTTLKPFVGVRITEIQTSWEQRCWRFVPTDLNPADDLSRGIPVQKLSERWMKGSALLRDNPEQWSSNPSTEKTEIPEVKSPKPIVSMQKSVTFPIIDPRDSRTGENYAESPPIASGLLRMLGLQNNVKMDFSSKKSSGDVLDKASPEGARRLEATV